MRVVSEHEPSARRFAPRLAALGFAAQSVRLWSKLIAACVALFLGGVVACNSPTIPIPPLRAPSFQMMGTDLWTASGGGAEGNSEVFVIDRTTGDGVSVRADANGGYTTPAFSGHANDAMELFYRTPRVEYSQSICAPLSVGTPQISACQ